MTNKLTFGFVALVLGGALAAGTLTSCDDDNDNAQVTGIAGRGGTTGIAGRGGAGGLAGAAAGGTGGATSLTVFRMNMTGTQETPSNTSGATGVAMVTLNRTTGEVVVDGTFTGLS